MPFQRCSIWVKPYFAFLCIIWNESAKVFLNLPQMNEKLHWIGEMISDNGDSDDLSRKRQKKSAIIWIYIYFVCNQW